MHDEHVGHLPSVGLASLLIGGKQVAACLHAHFPKCRQRPMAHTTIMRWVQRYAPEFKERWRRFAETPSDRSQTVPSLQ
jgi:hypothetical protein